MDHKEYIRINPEADTAVLFIHGIVGTPDHFDFLIPLVPAPFSVYNILLDGHGKTAKDFSNTSMAKWETQISDAVKFLLSQHKQLYIAAHSMGTLLAIGEAIQHPQIQGLFLMAVPIKIFPKPLMFRNTVKVYTGRIRENDRFGNVARAACSITPSKNPLHYLGWIVRYFELFGKIRRIRKILPDLKTPAIAIQSRHDEMVASNADDYLKNHSAMNVHTLEHSYHYLYDPNELAFVQQKFCDFLN